MTSPTACPWPRCRRLVWPPRTYCYPCGAILDQIVVRWYESLSETETPTIRALAQFVHDAIISGAPGQWHKHGLDLGE